MKTPLSLSATKRRLALTAVTATLAGAAFLTWHVNNPASVPNADTSDNSQTVLSAKPVAATSSHKALARTPGAPTAAAVAKPFVHPAWPRAQVLEVRESHRKADGSFTRTTLLRPKSMADAVVVEDVLSYDSHTGTQSVLSTSARAASRVVFALKAGEDETALDAFLASKGVRTIRTIRMSKTVQVVQLPQATIDGVPALLASLQPMAGQVDFAEPDYVSTIAATPNDTNFANQWHLNNTGQTGGTVDADIDAVEGWNIATGSSNVIVALVDTGARLTHEDLAANLWVNPDEISGNGIDDDANGYIDDVYGIDTKGDDTDPTDDNGHGTAIAGIIGAVGNNAKGVAGVAWNAKLMILKFQGSDGTGFNSDAAECVNYARLNGATIINNSWRSPNFNSFLLTALEDAENAGILLVASAGNDSTNLDFDVRYPASYELANQVVVTSTNDSDQFTSNANYGTGTVDIAAPGVNLYTTANSGDGAYDNTRSGTSLSSAVVAGMLAVLKGHFPAETNGELISRLYTGGDTVADLASRTATGKRANLNGALSLGTVVVIPQITSGLSNLEVTGGTAVNFTITATGTAPLTYAWTLNGTPLGSTSNTLNIPSASQGDAGTYVVTVTNAAGSASSTATLSVLSIDAALGDAVEAPALTWVTGRDAVWASTTAQSFQGGDSARSGTILDGQQSLMRTTVTGPGALTFKWKVSSEASDRLYFYVNGVLKDSISGEIDWSAKGFELNSGSQELTWIYQKDASVSAGTDAGWVDAVSYTAGGILPPTITTHPLGQTVVTGTNVTFTVGASGSGTLTYVWKKGTAVLDGQSGTSLVLNGVTTGSSGDYTAEVTNAGGTAVSNVATLVVYDVNPPPSISEHPASLTRLVGSTAVFTTAATGTGPITYNWQKGTTDIGRTGTTLTLSNLVIGDAGNYRAKATNLGGDSFSNPATLTVVSGNGAFATALDSTGINYASLSTTPWFVQSTESTAGGSALQSGAIGDDQSTSLDALVTGPGILSFDWKVSSEETNDTLKFLIDGTAQYTISGTTGSWTTVSLEFPAGTHDVSWVYAKDSGLTDGSDAAWVDNVQFLSLVGAAPYFTVQPMAKDLIAGETLTLTATAVGPGPISYQWKKGVDNVPSGTSATLSLANISAADAGNYTVVATNSNGPTPSTVASVAVFDAGNPLGVVLDATNLTFGQAGNLGWRPTAQTSHDGVDSARSGVITHNQTSSLTSTVTGPGTLSFWWMVSSEQDYDLLQFSINGVEQSVISGIGGTWAQLTYTLAAGTNNLAWTYTKDESGSVGSDAGWVDQIVLSTQDSLATWTSSKFSTLQQADPAISGPNADPDGDGYNNTIEFALGGEPFTRETNLTTSGKENVSGINYVTLVYTVAKNRTATVIVEQSQNLTSWVTTGVTNTMTGETTTTQTFKATAVVTNSTPTSLRLRIIAP